MRRRKMVTFVERRTCGCQVLTGGVCNARDRRATEYLMSRARLDPRTVQSSHRRTKRRTGLIEPPVIAHRRPSAQLQCRRIGRRNDGEAEQKGQVEEGRWDGLCE